MVKPHHIFFYLLFVSCAGLLKGQVTNYIITDRAHVLPLYDSNYTVTMPYRKPGIFCIYSDTTLRHKVAEIHYSDENDSDNNLTELDTIRYWYSSGQKKKIEWYVLENGRRMVFPSKIEYYRSGKTKARTFYPNDSLWVTHAFYESGAIKSIDTSTVDKTLQPTWRMHEEYCENGKRILRHSRNSYKTEQYYTFDCDGQIVIKAEGNIYGNSGLFQRFYPNGQVEYEGYFGKKIGEYTDKTGTWTFYAPNGKKTKEEYYEKGKLIREVKFD